jgi:transcriptional regulator with XRE-family HTH domain
MAQSDSWQARLTRVVADQVRRYRQERKMSAQQLADRCDQLGLSIPRPVLSNLENGRRESVSIAELLILAAALEVPPILLVAPVDRQPTIEVLPGKEFDPWSATLWISGEARLADPAGTPDLVWLSWRDDLGIVPLHRRHDQLVEDLSGEGLWSGAATLDPVETLKIQRELKDQLEGELRTVRARMRELDLTPPTLPAELAYIDQERVRDRRR